MNSTPQDVTRTAATDAQYERIYLRLVREAASAGVGGPVDLLCARAPLLGKKTVNLYRSAILAHLPSDPIMLAQLSQAITSARSKPTGRTSSMKAKNLNDQVWAKVRADLLAGGPEGYGAVAVAWVESGRVAGLRPVEWAGAYLQGTELLVMNRKATNGRSFGVTRSIQVVGLDDEAMLGFQEWCAFVAANRHRWGEVYEAARKALQRAVSRVRPRPSKRIALYTGRHQMSADGKAANLSKVQIAALMGQASTETATRHYGKKRYGNGRRLAVSPSAVDVQKVEALNRHREAAPSPREGPKVTPSGG